MMSRWSAIVIAVLLTACGTGEQGLTPAVPDMITGTATYRERMLLRPGAQLEISLQDVSLADAPAKILAMQRIDDPGAPPFDFRLAYDPATIDPAHTYLMRATVREGGRLMFTTDTAYPVLTRGAGNTVDMLMIRVQGQPASESEVVTSSDRVPATE